MESLSWNDVLVFHKVSYWYSGL